MPPLLPHMNTDPAFFNLPLTESDHLRARQAGELLAYFRALRAAGPAARARVFTPDYASPAAYEKSAAPLRAALEASLGCPPPGGTRDAAPAVAWQKLGQDTLGTYHRVRTPVLPGVHAEGLLLIPALPHPQHAAPSTQHSLLIAMHGGLGSPEVTLFDGGQNYNDLTRGALAQGYVVFAPTHLHLSKDHPRDIRVRADAQARMVGTTLAATEVWKISRALDALLADPRLAPILNGKIAMAGLSYGGFYTVLTMALDTRITAGVASCYARDEMNLWSLAGATGRDNDLHWDYRWMHGGTLSDNASLAALVCPRALQLQHGLGDDIIPAQVSAQMAAAAHVHYEKLGLADRLAAPLFAGWHEFSSALAWPFLAKHLQK